MHDEFLSDFQIHGYLILYSVLYFWDHFLVFFCWFSAIWILCQYPCIGYGDPYAETIFRYS